MNSIEAVKYIRACVEFVSALPEGFFSRAVRPRDFSYLSCVLSGASGNSSLLFLFRPGFMFFRMREKRAWAALPFSRERHFSPFYARGLLLSRSLTSRLQARVVGVPFLQLKADYAYFKDNAGN